MCECTIKYEKCAFSDCNRKAQPNIIIIHCIANGRRKTSFMFCRSWKMEPCCCTKNHKPHMYTRDIYRCIKYYCLNIITIFITIHRSVAFNNGRILSRDQINLSLPYRSFISNVLVELNWIFESHLVFSQQKETYCCTFERVLFYYCVLKILAELP